MTVAFTSATGTLTGDNIGSGGATISFSTPPNATDLVVVGGGFFAPSNYTPAASDNQTNSYSLDVVQSSATSTNTPPISATEVATAILAALNVVSSGTFTLTVGTGITGSYIAVGGIAFDNVLTSVAKDQTASARQSLMTLTSQVTGTTSATSQADEVAIIALAVADSLNNTSYTATGYTVTASQTDGTAHQQGAVGYQILSATGAQSATWTFGSTSAPAASAAGAIATYKGNGGSPPADTLMAQICM